MWLRIAEKGFLFGYPNEKPLSYYRRHSQNLTLQWEKMIEWKLSFINNYFSRIDLPTDVQEKRNRAISRIYFVASAEALRNEQSEKASGYFSSAVVNDPQLLDHQETYFEIACANQPIGIKGTNNSLNLAVCEANLFLVLNELFAKPDIPAGVLSAAHLYKAIAYLVLSKIAYGYLRDYSKFQYYIWKCISEHPPMFFRKDVASSIIKIALGHRIVGAARNIRYRMSSPNRQLPSTKN
jgi:hypothetical protein